MGECTINSDGVITREEELLFKSTATNISTTLLDGKTFAADSTTLSFANGTVAKSTSSREPDSYIVYNGNVYSYRFSEPAKINYTGDAIVSLTVYEKQQAQHGLVEVTYTKQ